MSLAQITEKIRNDAQSEADEILSKAKAKAQTIKEKAEEEKDIIKSSFDLRFQKERPEILRRREIVADLDVKKMMLRSRRDLISNVYAESLKKMGACQIDPHGRHGPNDLLRMHSVIPALKAGRTRVDRAHDAAGSPIMRQRLPAPP